MRTWAVSVVLLAAVAAGCSGAEPLDLAEFPPDGELDCTDDSSWGVQGAIARELGAYFLQRLLRFREFLGLNP